MKILDLLLVPSMVLSGPVTGVVTLLDGTPLPKAFVRLVTDTASTMADGTFSMGSGSGLLPRTARTDVSPHALKWSEGSLRLVFQGTDVLGRGVGAMPSGAPVALRIQAAARDLNVSWNKKNLATIPLPDDTGFLTIRIDTAWKDDRNIPWNPRINYGSLRDGRDGRTYRTVWMGSQNWMAENLSYTDADAYLGSCWGTGFVPSASERNECRDKGRLYGWKEMMAGDTDKAGNPLAERVRGICPAGWHIPQDTEWSALAAWTTGMVGTGSSATAALKSRKGWALPSDQGTDLLGFHVVPGGYYEANNITTNWYKETLVGVFWTGSGTRQRPLSRWFGGNALLLAPASARDQGDEISIRCVQD